MRTCSHCESTKFYGVEVRGVYDGVLFWVCKSCGVAVPREWGDWADMQAKANSYAESFNARMVAEG